MDNKTIINAIKSLAFNEDNFEFLKKELIKDYLSILEREQLREQEQQIREKRKLQVATILDKI